jgi:DNA-binding NarL/FixJ family response regulator
MSNAAAKILFVDDEANLLQGLKRMLRRQRNEWDMTFVDSGAKALAAFETNPFDVIVSDMRMPEMDGAELLNEVSQRHPGTIRIVLSGFAENEAVMRTVGPSHQYLAKPCDADTLIATINSAMRLRLIIDDESLRTFVSGLKTVPSLSAAYRALIDELEDPNASANKVGDTIAGDIGLAVQTLKLTNSAYFSLPSTVTSCRQAVQLLGFDTIRSLVTVANFYQEFSGNPEQIPIVEAITERSLEIGALAREITSAEGLEKPAVETAFCAGMLAHIGTLIFVANFPDRYDKVIAPEEEKNIPILQAESEELAASHAQLGAYLLGL